VNGPQSTWMLVSSRVLQGSVLGLVHLNTFTDDLEELVGSALIKFAYNNIISQYARGLCCRSEAPSKAGEMGHKDKFSKGKRKVLYLGRNTGIMREQDNSGWSGVQ